MREAHMTVNAGEFVVRDGDPGRDMYVIRSGRIRISRRLGGEERELAVLEKGQFFGEMSLLESLPREADAVALEDCELLVIGPGDLLMRFRRDPTFAIEMLHVLSGRIRGLLGRLDEALGDGTFGGPSEQATSRPGEVVEP